MGFDFKYIEPPPGILPKDWQSPNWQIKNSLKSFIDFKNYYELSVSEEQALLKGKELFRFRSTPYYCALSSPTDQADPIRKIILPTSDELFDGYQAQLDPLGERKNNPAPRIIHRYPDRCLFLVTDFCSVYCRYCTRKHFTGQDQVFPKRSEYEAGLEYIKKTTSLREVILSGGDPLTLSDEKLERVLHDLRQVPHIEIIRIGSRMPTVLPMRVSAEVTGIFKKYKPIYFMTHFNHPDEVTAQAAQALELLADSGVPLFNQMVLLNGVNNHEAIVQALSRRLLYLRVKPYYMFQCDPSKGTDHLRTSVEDSKKIQKNLWGRLSGLAMPNLSLDIPDGGGKMGIVPNFITGQNGNELKLKGWDGIQSSYISPPQQDIIQPPLQEAYKKEWQSLNSHR